MAQAAVQRIIGSPDLYQPDKRPNASVNFITCHDGFTLHDLYAYNQKHNEANGWNNTDGSDANYSWNCGTEALQRIRIFLPSGKKCAGMHLLCCFAAAGRHVSGRR